MRKPTLFIGLLLAIVLDTTGQLLWKVAASHLNSAQLFASMLSQPLFLAVGVIFTVQLFNWLFVLEHADLSYAQPITSLSYVTVCTISAWQLSEHIGILKAIGIASVLLGVWFLSRSIPKSESP